MPTILYNRTGDATNVRMTNVSSRVASCPEHFPILLWLPNELIPRYEGYVRIEALKYHDWRVLAIEQVMDNGCSEKSNIFMQNGCVNKSEKSNIFMQNGCVNKPKQS